MEQKRYFGTYNGEMVEYFPLPFSNVRLSDGSLVYEKNITPSPYPWQFHTKEFWDAYPGMRWAYSHSFRWSLTDKMPVRFGNQNGYYIPTGGNVIHIDFCDTWQGNPAASLFENPFFRHYPAELDDPLWWRDNAPEWATCGSWDLLNQTRPFNFYDTTPRKGNFRVWSISHGCDYVSRFAPMDGRYTGTWEDCPLIMRPAAKVPMVKHPKAAPKRAEKPLSVWAVNRVGVRFCAKTKAARQWLNEQAPPFGEFIHQYDNVFILYTDFPAAAMRYLLDGFYNRNKPTNETNNNKGSYAINAESVDGVTRFLEGFGAKVFGDLWKKTQPDIIRKHYPNVTAEPQKKPRIEKRTIDEITDGTLCNGKIINEFRIYLKKDGICTDHAVTRECLLDLMRRFDLVYYRALIGKEITVRIDADKLVIVEDGE